MGELLTPGHLIVFAFVGGIWGTAWVLPFWMIFKKAGFTPALSLLMVIPLVNIVMLFVLAFARWPALKSAEPDSVVANA